MSKAAKLLLVLFGAYAFANVLYAAKSMAHIDLNLFGDQSHHGWMFPWGDTLAHEANPRQFQLEQQIQTIDRDSTPVYAELDRLKAARHVAPPKEWARLDRELASRRAWIRRETAERRLVRELLKKQS